MAPVLERTNSSIDHYRDALLPVYQDACGDTASYNQVEYEFERYLSHTQFEHPENAEVKMLSAAPDEAASVLKRFLDGGRNCPDGSFRGQARSNAISFYNAARKITFLADGDTRHISDPDSLYLAWQNFLKAYIGSINDLNAAVENFTADETLDFIRLREMLLAVGRAEMIADEMDEQMKLLRTAELTVLWQGASVHFQHQKINNFRNILMMIKGVNPQGTRFRENLDIFLDIFPDSYRSLFDPFVWVSTMTYEVLRVMAPQIKVTWPADAPTLGSNNIIMLIKLIDELAAWAIEVSRGKETSNVDFRWNGFIKRFIVTMPAVDEPPLAVRYLLRQLNGEYETLEDGETTEIRVPMKVVSRPSPVSGGGDTGDPHDGNNSIPSSHDPVISGMEAANETFSLPVMAAPALGQPTINAGMMIQTQLPIMQVCQVNMGGLFMMQTLQPSFLGL